MKTEKRKIGDSGEEIACKFLLKNNFSISERNYLKKLGEIDIVAIKDKKTHFIEVKTLRFVDGGHFKPEDNAHKWKLEKMARVVEIYVLERGIVGEWQCDLVTVEINFNTKKARVKMIPYII